MQWQPTITTSLRKISHMDGRLRIVQGGARAGKTFAIMLLLVNHAITHANQRIGIFSFSYPHLKRGAMLDFVKIMESLGIFQENRFNRSDRIYKFDNKSTIEFLNADSFHKIQGTQYDVTFVNECRHVSFEFFNQLQMRTIRTCFVDFNPTTKFYVHEYIGKDKVSFLKLTYEDNEMCPSGIIEEFERIKDLAKTSKYWSNYAKIFVYGEIGGSIDIVYPDWTYVEEIPEHARLIGIGVDFGFTNDVTAIVAIHYADGFNYVQELAYKKGMLTKHIAAVLFPFINVPIYCDNAEPRLREELKGLLKRQNIFGVKFKINESIQFTQQQPIRVLYSAENTIKEHQEYVFIRDKFTGELTNNPIGTDNHAMDAIRYAINGKFNTKQVIYQKVI